MPKRRDIVVNDYAGHPFQVELSAELAGRGHAVAHAYCSTNVTPRGDLTRDTTGLTIHPIATGSGFAKYSAGRRLIAEIRYGLGSVRLLRRTRPSVCLSSNMPIISLALITLACKAMRIRPGLWLQDLQSGLIAMALGSETHLIVRLMEATERWCVRNAAFVVTISDGFENEVLRMGVPVERVRTIQNWAPLDEVPVLPKSNPWAAEHGLDSVQDVVVYSGSMGIKHRPKALVDLSVALSSYVPDAKIVIVSEGVGADWLMEQAEKQKLENFVFLPFQPFERLPEVLATADALVVLLEPDAGEFSVPSKVLTYLCSERPVVGLMPPQNAASRLVAEEAAAGLVADNEAAFVENALRLLRDSKLRDSYGRNGRKYAETHFERAAIADRFLDLLEPVDRAGTSKPAVGRLVGRIASFKKMEMRK